MSVIDAVLYSSDCLNPSAIDVLVRVEFPDYTGEKVETALDNTYM